MAINLVSVFLIVTMTGHSVFSYRGYGGVSVTPTNSLTECNILENAVRKQIEREGISPSDYTTECKVIQTPKQESK